MPFSQGTQMLNGLTKVTIPLMLFAFCFKIMSGFVNELFQFVVVLCACETVAYMVNPLQIWAMENNLEYKNESLLNTLKNFLNNEKK